jgi:D-beta-D-heptose 7-phosphate kinase/D-beta-D-heptose 1-phosphate adenosyltransferase
MDKERLTEVVARLGRATIGCVGDVMLDHFVYGNVHRISPEAPVPVLHVERQQSMLGGAGNAVRNLTALGCGVRFYSVTGDDAEAGEIERMLGELPQCTWRLERDARRPTTIKTRYVAEGQQIMRADVESGEAAPEHVLGALLERFSAEAGGCDAVLLSDYAKGLLSGDHAPRFIAAARKAGKAVIVDPKGRDFRRYDGATVIKPNLKELGEAAGMPVASAQEQEAAARRLLEQIDVEHLLVTCGAAGMLLASRGGTVWRRAAWTREVFDVSGAGDTVAAVVAAGIGSGAEIHAAVEAANVAAGIVVGKHGTAVTTPEEIVDRLRIEG